MGDSGGTAANSAGKAIVCAVDHSPHAHAVAYAAGGMAMIFGAGVILFRSDRRADGGRADQTAHGELETLAHHSIGKPTGGHVRVRVDVTAEKPADGVRRHIAATQPVAVLMGSRGRTLLARSIFGSTALSLMKSTTVPLMMLPPSDPEVFTVTPDGVQCHMGAVLIPVDFSEAMEGQLRFAGTLLATEMCPVTLVHVARKGESDRHMEDMEQAKGQLQAGRHPVDTMVVEGDVRRVLGDLLSGDKFGMVVVGRDHHHAGAVALDLLRVSTSLVAVA